jgi:hypothetical protein
VIAPRGAVIAPRGASGLLVYLADLVGTFVIAIEGATVATRGQRDLFGMLVLPSPPRCAMWYHRRRAACLGANGAAGRYLCRGGDGGCGGDGAIFANAHAVGRHDWGRCLLWIVCG